MIASFVRPFALLLMAAALVACGGSTAEEAPDAPAESATVLEQAVRMPDGSDVAGAPLAAEVATATLADVLAHPETYDGELVRLSAEIDEVCQASGCWMIVAEGEAESRVTFQDYGFFVPKDAAGRIVEMDVRIARATMSVDEAKHLASETEGGDPDAITEPVETVSVVATGVRILPAKSEGE